MTAGRQFSKQAHSSVNKPVCSLRCQTHQTPLVPGLFLSVDDLSSAAEGKELASGGSSSFPHLLAFQLPITFGQGMHSCR